MRERQRVGRERAEANRPRVVEIARAHGLTLASHDDTTLEDVALAQREGVSIAEFPTTLEAAAASHEAGMATVMGAPNVVRGGSHSGNASARDFAEAGLLDILSSDYVPASLLMGAFRLADAPNVGGLPGAIRLVTKNPAEAAGLPIAARSRSAAAPTWCACARITASRWFARCGAPAAGWREAMSARSQGSARCAACSSPSSARAAPARTR